MKGMVMPNMKKKVCYQDDDVEEDEEDEFDVECVKKGRKKPPRTYPPAIRKAPVVDNTSTITIGRQELLWLLDKAGIKVPKGGVDVRHTEDESDEDNCFDDGYGMLIVRWKN